MEEMLCEPFLDWASNNPMGAMMLQISQQQEELSASVSTLMDMPKFVQDSNLWENRLHWFCSSKNCYFFFGIHFHSWPEFIFFGIGYVERALVMPPSGLLVELLHALATTF